MSTVHRLTVQHGEYRYPLVLRQYERSAAHYGDGEVVNRSGLIEREAGILRRTSAAGLAAPEFVASSPDGEETSGHPSLLMTRLRGRVHLTPEDPGDWLRQMAVAAARIDAAPVRAPTFERLIDPAGLRVPASATRPEVWRAVIAVLAEDRGSARTTFIHRDFQHFNLLWARGRLTGVVDWGNASAGLPDLDAGHCRLNLAVLFGADWAERFRLAYEAETGRRVDPWWDLHAMASYGDSWPEFIPVQVAGRRPVDTAGMTARVEELLEGALRRL